MGPVGVGTENWLENCRPPRGLHSVWGIKIIINSVMFFNLWLCWSIWEFIKRIIGLKLVSEIKAQNRVVLLFFFRMPLNPIRQTFIPHPCIFITLLSVYHTSSNWVVMCYVTVNKKLTCIIIIYFENVHFFHATLGLDIFWCKEIMKWNIVKIKFKFVISQVARVRTLPTFGNPT